ncbi:MAG: fumarylacetoacetate hydrolase family protein [Alphaproteobacteria bacterium]|nr:fumarylacetoacetate hydrolase family protein [Alphaproteobacteria bacterium]
MPAKPKPGGEPEEGIGPTRVIQAARLLLNARGDFRQIAGFPEECRPRNMDDAYLIQKTFAEEWELPVVGYKIGCTARNQQRMLKVKEPFYARLFSPFVKDSPAELSAGAFHQLGLESEFAFRLKRSIKPRANPYTREEVTKAVGVMHPAIEVVDTRLDNWLTRGAPSVVADNGANGALIIGEAIKEWRKLDLAKTMVVLTIDGERIGAGTGVRVLGHPLESLTWLVNKLSATGITLESDQIVTTGTVTGLNFARPGSTGIAKFRRIGEVKITFTG